MSRMLAPQCRARSSTCATIGPSVGELSSGTRMRLYTTWTSRGGCDYALLEPVVESLVEQPGVEHRDDDTRRPRERLEPRGVHELPHLGTIAGELHQWEDREGELQAEDHLAQDEEFRRPALARDDRDDPRRPDRDAARDEPPHPRPEPDVE